MSFGDARTPRAPLLALLLTALLVPGATADHVTEEKAPEYSLLAVERSGNSVTLTVDARTPRWEVVVSLRDGTERVGLPDRSVEWLDADAPKELTFTVREDATAGDLHFYWKVGSHWYTQVLGVQWPASSAPPQDAGPRLAVMDAVWTGAGVNVTLANVGDAVARDVLVSLEDANGQKTGRPFHRLVTALGASQRVDLAFAFPDVVKEVTVVLEHANTTERVLVGVAQPDDEDDDTPVAGAPNVTLVVDLPFKEVEIGRTVDYALTVRNTGGVALVELAATGLPDGYSARFFVGGAAVPRLFVDTNASRAVTLSVTVPNEVAEVDRTVEFDVVARANGTTLADVPAGLAVRGVGRLEVTGGLDVSRIPAGASEERTVVVKNTGSAPLFDVQVDASGPYGWSFTFDPRRIDRLDPGEEHAVNVLVRAPDVVGSGRYVADITATSGATSSRALTVGMEVPTAESGSDWTGLVFLVLIGGILGGAAWWKRRGT